MPPTKRTPLEDVQTVLKNNLFIQYASIIPIVAIFIWFFGFYSAWGSILIVAIGYSVRFVASQKNSFYTNFTETTPLTRNRREVQHCAWLNLLVRKYWQTCVPKFVEPQIENVNRILQEKKPGFMKKLEIGPWNLGDRAPRITQIYAPIILSDDRYILEFEILFVPDLNVEVHVQPLSALLMKVVGTEVKFKGRMRLTFNFNDLFPECSVVSVCFIEDPLVEVSVRPVRKLDFCSVPLVYELINEITKSNLQPVMVQPNKLQFSLGGGQVETYETMEKPITDIVIIYSETSKAPPGYVLLQRTASGVLPANLNSGNKGKELYICYKREDGAQPITGLCIFYPDYDVKQPSGFEVITETPSAEPASLNIGNDGIEAFLCITRQPGNPVTGLTIVNETEDYILPEDFQILELSPTGKSANLNKRAKGDRLFLSFKGGCDTYFGYNMPRKNPEAGLLRVEIVEAKNLVGVDLGGTSDPYCEVIIGDMVPQKNAKAKLTRVVDKNLSPKWDEKFVFQADRTNSILTVNIYDKDKIEIDPDHLGRIQLSLKDLVVGKSVDQWVPLQMVDHGEVRLCVTALNFGLDPDVESKPFEPLEVSKYSNTPLFMGLGAVGGLCGKGIKGVANIGGMGVKGVTDIGGMGVKGVTDVGEMGIKGVTSVGKGVANIGGMGVKGVTDIGGMGVKGVTDVGEMGFKGVTSVGKGVADIGGMGVKGVSDVGKGVTGAVGGLFHKKKKSKVEAEVKEGAIIDSNKDGDNVVQDNVLEVDDKHDADKGMFKNSMDSIGGVFGSKKHKKDKKEDKHETKDDKDEEKHEEKHDGVLKSGMDSIGGVFGSKKNKKDKKDKKEDKHETKDDNDEEKHDDKDNKSETKDKDEEKHDGVLKSSMGSIGNVFGSKKHEKKPKRDKSDKSIKGFFGKKKEHAKEIDENHPIDETPKEIESNEKSHNEAIPDKVPITTEGNLEKMSTGKLHLKSSHKRFCCLQADSLLAYKSKKEQSQSKSPLESYPLAESQISSSKEKNCFDITHNGSTTTFKCSSNEELQMWLSSVNNNIKCLS